MKLITTDENTRRKVSLSHDTDVSYHHIFNFKIAKPYIKNKRVLDIGCWTGQFELLATEVTDKIVGIDPSKEAIKLAKKRVPKASFKTGDALKLTFSKNKFDCVTFLEVIEHLPHGSEDGVIKEIYRITKPKGYLILSTPNNHPISIILDPAFFLINHRHYSLKQLESLLVSNGYKIILTKQTGGIFTLTSHLFELFLKHAFRRSFRKPSWIERQIKNEYVKNGFAENHIIARKI